MSLLQLASLAKASHINSSGGPPLMDGQHNVLETFIPGYSTVIQAVLARFSIDINSIITVSLFAFALGRSASYLKERVMTLLMQHGTCSVEIDADSDQYLWIMAWLADRGIGINAAHLRAVSSNVRPYGIPLPPRQRLDRRRRRASRAEPKEQEYEPAPSQTQYFWHKGRLFRWHRKQDGRSGEATLQGLLSCVTYSTGPIKDLIEAARASYCERNAQRTAIRRPAPRSRRNMGMNVWNVVSQRQSRPLDTVVLGRDQKDRLLLDVEEYLKPASREWYAVRGIPYRRGYLLHGPCGTGKTSLAFAIAGSFNLDVYCISLAEPSITEEDLVALFDELPENCLVLLEDVDSAGLIDRAAKAAPSTAHVVPGHLPPPPPPPPGMYDDGRGISLSGLLNVIDGVASQEGRVLIMTTNRIDALDPALLRPGRVDLRIRFDLATREQAAYLFLQTFVDGTPGGEEEAAAAAAWTKDGLGGMAAAFAAAVPDRALSPAEIQGFLLNWRHRPAEALERVGAWVSETLKEKEARAAAKGFGPGSGGLVL